MTYISNGDKHGGAVCDYPHVRICEEAGTELVSVHIKNRNGIMPFRFFMFYAEIRRVLTPSAHISLNSRPLMPDRFHFQPLISHERKTV